MKYSVINKYGVKLNRLTHDKIELVRRWRNHPKISKYMEYRNEITPEMQERWFDKINNDNNYFFLIEVDNKEIGLINVRDIDYERKEGEPGIFIWDDDYLNSTISFQAAMALTDFCFEDLGLSKLIIHVLHNNVRAIKYNLAFGYKISPCQGDIYNQEYTLTFCDYKNKRNKLLKLLRYGD